MKGMNRVFRLVWSRVQNRLVVCSELVRSRSKASASGASRTPLAATSVLNSLSLQMRRALMASWLAVLPTSVLAEIATTTLPSGGTVAAGSVSMATNANTLNITQSTDKAIVNWNSFDIGRDATVNILQPSAQSALLNRVQSSAPTQIFGQLNANGQVFLINPHGVVFGQSARVDVGGLVASALDIKDEDFLNENYAFFGGGVGRIANYGSLTGGFVSLIAPEIENDGDILARISSVALGSGDAATLTFADNALISLQVEEAKLKSAITNSGSIVAENGLVILKASAAQSLVDDMINAPEGSSNLVTVNGVPQLITNNGTITAKNITLDAGDNGATKVAGTLSVKSADATAGKIEVLGEEVHLTETAKLDATGKTGGGQILVGGDWQGSNEVRQAIFTTVERGAYLDASATQLGDGGTIVTWSNIGEARSVTEAHGTFFARGGEQGGDGGRIETSGHVLRIREIEVNTSALKGVSGNWLIDPYDIIIGPDSYTASGSTLASGSLTAAAATVIKASTIETALGSSNVTIQTGGSTSSFSGDILVNTDITYTGSAERTLSLIAHRDILVHGALASSDGKLNIDLTATGDSVFLGDAITTKGGALTVGASDVTFQKTSGTQEIDTRISAGTGGAVNFGGANLLIASGGDGLSITTGGGAFTSNGKIDSASSTTSRRVSESSNLIILGKSNSANGVTSTTTFTQGGNDESQTISINATLWDSWDWDNGSGRDYVYFDIGGDYLYLTKANVGGDPDLIGYSTTTITDDPGANSFQGTTFDDGSITTSNGYTVTILSETNLGGSGSIDPTVRIQKTTTSTSVIVGRYFTEGADTNNEAFQITSSSITGPAATSLAGKSSLSVHTGAGTLQLDGVVGGDKALQNFSVTTSADLTIDNSVTVAGDVSLTGGVVRVDSNITSNTVVVTDLGKIAKQVATFTSTQPAATPSGKKGKSQNFINTGGLQGGSTKLGGLQPGTISPAPTAPPAPAPKNTGGHSNQVAGTGQGAGRPGDGDGPGNGDGQGLGGNDGVQNDEQSVNDANDTTQAVETETVEVAAANNGDKEAGAGGSDENNNSISGELGNQGNDKLVGNAGGEKAKSTEQADAVVTLTSSTASETQTAQTETVEVAAANNGDKEAGAGGSDENNNSISGELGNQGNDKLVGNAGGQKAKSTEQADTVGDVPKSLSKNEGQGVSASLVKRDDLILESMAKTNQTSSKSRAQDFTNEDVIQVKRPPSYEMAANQGSLLVYQFPENTFVHSNPEGRIAMEVRMKAEEGLTNLPDWLAFDPNLKQVKGMVPENPPKSILLRAIGRDQWGGEVFTDVEIQIR